MFFFRLSLPGVQKGSKCVYDQWLSLTMTTDLAKNTDSLNP